MMNAIVVFDIVNFPSLDIDPLMACIFLNLLDFQACVVTKKTLMFVINV